MYLCFIGIISLIAKFIFFMDLSKNTLNAVQQRVLMGTYLHFAFDLSLESKTYKSLPFKIQVFCCCLFLLLISQLCSHVWPLVNVSSIF